MANSKILTKPPFFSSTTSTSSSSAMVSLPSLLLYCGLLSL
jgi:hypothetical protein